MNLQETLAQNPHLGNLSPEDRAALASAMRVSEHDQGHVFIEEGAPGDELFLLLEGEVMVTRTRAGTSIALKLLRAGELFGLIALLDDEPRSATCRAAGPVRVAVLQRRDFESLFFSNEPVAAALHDALVAQLTLDFRNVNRQICEVLTRSNKPEDQGPAEGSGDDADFGDRPTTES
jgi:CRP-like cAMP-binding protein